MGRVINKAAVLTQIDAYLKEDLIPVHVAGYRYIMEGVYYAIQNPSASSTEMFEAIAKVYDVDADKVRFSMSNAITRANSFRKQAGRDTISVRRYAIECANRFYNMDEFMIEVPDA